MNILYDDVPDTLSQLIRTSFVPKPGYKFCVADFSAIEASLNAICEQMGRTPDWIEGICLRADGYETSFYKKD